VSGPEKLGMGMVNAWEGGDEGKITDVRRWTMVMVNARVLSFTRPALCNGGDARPRLCPVVSRVGSQDSRRWVCRVSLSLGRWVLGRREV
jgi:hypothetical protein